jgi:hypothetical protein
VTDRVDILLKHPSATTDQDMAVRLGIFQAEIQAAYRSIPDDEARACAVRVAGLRFARMCIELFTAPKAESEAE